MVALVSVVRDDDRTALELISADEMGLVVEAEEEVGPTETIVLLGAAVEAKSDDVRGSELEITSVELAEVKDDVEDTTLSKMELTEPERELDTLAISDDEVEPMIVEEGSELSEVIVA